MLRSRPHLQTPHQPQQFALTPRFSSASFNLKPDINLDENRYHSSAAPPSSSPGIPRSRPRLPVHSSDEIEEGNSDKGEDETQEAADDDDLRAAGVDQKHLTSTALYSSLSPARKRRRRFKPVEPMDPDT
ncbi:hypothetical protein MMC29_002931, partial [Sticta canariensis]|nr:hypothetical protein [Sticta canariensis]